MLQIYENITFIVLFIFCHSMLFFGILNINLNILNIAYYSIP